MTYTVADWPHLSTVEQRHMLAHRLSGLFQRSAYLHYRKVNGLYTPIPAPRQPPKMRETATVPKIAAPVQRSFDRANILAWMKTQPYVTSADVAAEFNVLSQRAGAKLHRMCDAAMIEKIGEKWMRVGSYSQIFPCYVPTGAPHPEIEQEEKHQSNRARVLALLTSSPGLTNSEIAEQLSMARSSATNATTQLVSVGELVIVGRTSNRSRYALPEVDHAKDTL